VSPLKAELASPDLPQSLVRGVLSLDDGPPEGARWMEGEEAIGVGTLPETMEAV
jgi:hypothetical protein